jgi:hypothetical protein
VDRPILYVRSDTASGNGTRSAPFASIGEAIAAAPNGAVIAIAKGRYRENLEFNRGLSLIGACASETILENASPSDMPAIVVAGGSAHLEHLRIDAGGFVGLLVDGAQVETTSLIVADAALAGIQVSGTSASLNATDMWITRTQQAAGPFAAYASAGLVVQSGANARVQRTALEDNVFDGILVADGASVFLEDVAVRRTQPNAENQGGHGLHAQANANVEVFASVFDLNHEAGISMTSSTLRLRRSVVRRTQPNPTRPVAFGINAQSGAMVSIEASALEDNDYVAAHGEDVGTNIELRDVLIIGTTAHVEGAGLGLTITDGARANVERLALLQNHSIGLALWGRGTHLEALDLTVSETGPDPVYGDFGRGIEITNGATMNATRVLLDRNREAGLSVNREARATLVDAMVRGTLARDCATTSCPESPLGMGIVVFDQGELSIGRFEISTNALAGAQMVDGEMRLFDGIIRAHPIGLNIQSPGVEIADLVERVMFLDNDRNLARDAFEAPAAFVP